MKIILSIAILLSPLVSFAAELKCGLNSGGDTLLDKTIQLTSGEDEDFVFNINTKRDSLKLNVSTNGGQNISLLMLTDNNTEVSAYFFDAMGGEDNAEINMLIKSISFEAYCYVR